MSRYVYSWSRRYPVDAQVAGEIIQKAKTAEALLEGASITSSPLHACFNWDDTVAANEYRLIQARVMINSIRVEVVNGDAKPHHVVAFIASADRVGYIQTLEADDESLSAAELRCWQQMKAFRERWKSLQFARGVVEQIQEVERRVSRKRPGRKAG
jgi:hypothetical protein